MAGYTRQSSAQIQDGQVVSASPLNLELDTVQGAFSHVSGHKHDGTPWEGAPITTLGPSQNVNATATDLYPRVDNFLSLGTSALQFKDLFVKGSASLGPTNVTGALSVTTSLTTPTVVANVASNGYTFTGLGSGLRAPVAGTAEVYGADGNKVVVSSTGTAITGPASVSTTLSVTGDATLSAGAVLGAGSASSPAIRFAGDVNTGIYQVGQDQLGIATNGVTRAIVTTADVNTTVPVRLPVGSLTAPSLSFSSDTNTGFMQPVADTVGFVAGGQYAGAFTTSGLELAPNKTLRLGTGGTITFPNTGTEIIPVVAADVTSTAAQIIVTLPQQIPTMFWLWPFTTNTGSVTIRVNGAGAQSVRTPTGGVLPAGYLDYDDVDHPFLFVYSSGNWVAFRQFESGTTADGYWSRFPSGLQICTHTVAVGDVTTATGSSFITAAQTWNYPKPFITTTFHNVTGSVESTVGRWFSLGSVTTTTAIYRVASPVSSTGAGNVRLMAVGRWFA